MLHAFLLTRASAFLDALLAESYRHLRSARHMHVSDCWTTIVQGSLIRWMPVYPRLDFPATGWVEVFRPNFNPFDTPRGTSSIMLATICVYAHSKMPAKLIYVRPVFDPRASTNGTPCFVVASSLDFPIMQ